MGGKWKKDKENMGYVSPEILLKLLIADDKEDELEMLDRDDMKLTTSMFALYEAFCSIEEDDNVDYNMLTEIIENIEIKTHDEMKRMFGGLKEERKRTLRDRALNKNAI